MAQANITLVNLISATSILMAQANITLVNLISATTNLICRNCQDQIQSLHEDSECICKSCQPFMEHKLCKYCYKFCPQLSEQNGVCWICSICFKKYGKPNQCTSCWKEAAFGKNVNCRHCKNYIRTVGSHLSKCSKCCKILFCKQSLCYQCYQKQKLDVYNKQQSGVEPCKKKTKF